MFYRMSLESYVKVTFQRPVIATTVIIYLASDGIHNSDPQQTNTLSVNLIDVYSTSHPMTSSDEIVVSCRDSPLHLNVLHDLSRPLFKTTALRIEFRSYHIAISAVALRTSDMFNALEANTCDSDSLYNTQTGRCVPYQCNRPVCPTFMIFGSAHCSGVKEGDTCSVDCDRGYELDSSAARVRCVNESWEGQVKCTPIDCGQAFIPHARVDCPRGTTYGRSCKFECRNPARKHGSGHMIECQADGVWSSADAFCQVVCPRAPRVNNASLVGRQCRVGRLGVGNKCRFRCSPGFHVVGEPIKRRLFRQTCTDDGTWSGPGCKRVECMAPSVVYQGLYSCTDDYFSGSRCTLTCPSASGPTSAITCLRSGEWNSEFPSCAFLPGQCPPPTENDDIIYRCKGTDIGSECTVVCALPSQEPALVTSIISDKAKLLRAGKGYVPVSNITCTGLLRWFPDTAGLACVLQCSSDFIGDGFCDARNNQAFCAWHGGDCCASTVSGDVIQTVPVTCAEDCVCRDPHAIENRNHNRVRAHFRHHHNIHRWN